MPLRLSGDGLSDVDDPRFADLILKRPEHRIEKRPFTGRVLITGAAGYIGSALCGHFAQNAVALDNSESALSALFSQGVTVELADIRDRTAMSAVFARHRPETVIHAAAYKHLPLLERFPFEAFATNSIGTRILADLAEAHGTERFILVSTDKAADPVSILGVSKRVAELVVLSRTQSKTTFSAVRLGNVFGSTGSVVPIFARQIAEGGPVTVTDARASRFFITCNEAIDVLSAIAQLEEGPGLFAYAPAPALAIAELAGRMIHTLSRTGRIGIAFSGLRAGEKLIEKLQGERERMVPHSTDGILRIESAVTCSAALEIAVAEIAKACGERNLELLMSTARGLVPEYSTSA